MRWLSHRWSIPSVHISIIPGPLAICFPDPHPSPSSTLSTALQLSSQTLRAITLEILWTRVEFDGPLDPKTRLISRDHICHIVRAILIKGMEKSWSTTIWCTLLSLLQSIPNLRKVFFEQIGTLGQEPIQSIIGGKSLQLSKKLICRAGTSSLFMKTSRFTPPTLSLCRGAFWID